MKNLAPQSSSVSVIILSYNRPDLLEQTLEGVARQTKELQEVIVLDNKSPRSEEIEAMVTQKFSQMTWFAQKDNAGFPCSFNRAFQKTTADWVLFLVDDVVLEADYLATLLSESESWPEADILNGLVLETDGTINYSGGELALDKSFQISVSKERPDENAQPRPVTYATGAVMLISRKAYERLQGYDEDIFIYYEDVDLSWRVVISQRQIVFVPKAVSRHIGAAGSQPGRLVSDAKIYSYYHIHFKFLSSCRLLRFLLGKLFFPPEGKGVRFAWIKSLSKLLNVRKKHAKLRTGA